jgi:ATP-binding cassette subfamily C protein
MLIAAIRRRPRDAAWLAFWSLVQALPAMASGWVLAEATGMFLTGRPLAGLGWLGLMAVAALAGAFGTRLLYPRLGAIVEPLRDELAELIVAGALYRSTRAGNPPDTDAVARLTHQSEIVRDSFAGLLTVACTFVFTAGSTLAGLITLVPTTLPYVVPPLVVSVLILRLLLRPFAVRQRTSVAGEETVARDVAAAINGLRDVTACGAEVPVLAGLDEQVRRQAAASRSVARIGALRLLCLAVGGWLPLLLVLLAAPHLLRSGVSAAHLVGAIAYIGGSLRSTLGTLTQGLGAGLVRLTVTLDRIREQSAYEECQGPAQEPPTVRIDIENVRFGYGAEPVITDLSLQIAPGEHLAIVGPSGVGKSSLAGLLSGLLTPDGGQVLIGGVPASACLPAERVLIPQEAYVFAGTLAENITYLGQCDELEAAAEAVGLARLAAQLGGYQAQVDPARLSAGQRQLIALARAYLSPAPIVILDEATCHLDPAAEARAEQAFARRHGTLIVIAHRISSALRAERILVLDGRHAEAGQHAALLDSSPMYRDLVGYWSGGPTDLVPQRMLAASGGQRAQGVDRQPRRDRRQDRPGLP